MTDITVPKLNTNDASYQVIEWLVADGGRVAPGEPLVVVETSKAQEELAAPAAGVVHALSPAGGECHPGGVIGHVHSSEAEASRCTHPEPPSATGLVVTNDAQALIDAHGITQQQLDGLRRTVIRAADVARLVAGPGPENGDPAPSRDGAAGRHRLTPSQQAVAEVVSRSARTIPAAAIYAKLALDAGREPGPGNPAPPSGDPAPDVVREPGLLVHALAGLHQRHPVFFATVADDGTVLRSPAPSIGVTMDAGHGLFVPVIHNASSRSLREIIDILADYRIKALRGNFRAHELAGANIMVALHNDAGITLATPIIFPGQACVISLAGRQEELIPGDDGRVLLRSYVQLGLLYDHRLINGRDAVIFMDELKRALHAGSVTGGSG